MIMLLAFGRRARFFHLFALGGILASVAGCATGGPAREMGSGELVEVSYLTFEVAVAEPPVDQQVLDDCRAVLADRLKVRWGSKIALEREGADRLVVRISATPEDSAEIRAQLRSLVEKRGELALRILAERQAYGSDAAPGLDAGQLDEYRAALRLHGPADASDGRYRWFSVRDVVKFLNLPVGSGSDEIRWAVGANARLCLGEWQGEHYVLACTQPEAALLLGGAPGGACGQVRDAAAGMDSRTGRHFVDFAVDASAAEGLERLTGRHIGQTLGIFLDDQALSYAVIQSRISGRCRISGDFSKSEAEELAALLETGTLPVRLRLLD